MPQQFGRKGKHLYMEHYLKEYTRGDRHGCIKQDLEIQAAVLVLLAKYAMRD